MHDARLWVVLLQAGNQAVPVQRVPSGNAEQQMWFAHQQQIVVGMQDRDRFATVRYQIGWRVDVLRRLGKAPSGARIALAATSPPAVCIQLTIKPR